MIEKKYFPNLDGLRAYTALLILLANLHIPQIPSTFHYGVHTFFVLSGYLITNILLDSKESKNFFKVFYVRRALRIFPIYFICLCFVAIYAIFTHQSINDLPYYLGYIQNYKLGFDNWHTDFPIMFNHTWTLAIEEQFYLVFPFLVFFLSKQKLLKTLGFLLVMSAASRFLLILVFRDDNSISWLSTVSNLDMLSAGSILAILSKKFNLKLVCFFLFFMSCVLMYIYLISSRLFQYTTFFDIHLNGNSWSGQLFAIVLLPISTFLVGYLSYTNNFFIQIIFSNKVVVYLGKISYGIYLYHNIVYSIVDDFLKDIYQNSVLIVVKLSLTILISCLSWHLLESKILGYKRYFQYQY